MAVVGVLLYVFLIKKPTQGSETTAEINADTVQNFLPIDHVENDVIVLKDGSFCRVIECGSNNWDFMTEDEQDTNNQLFQAFLNSLSFPISVFIQTRIIDNSKRIEYLTSQVEETIRTFPSLRIYAEKYLDEMENINDFLGNSTQKVKMIIVRCKENLEIEGMDTLEKKNHALKELDNRCFSVVNGLASVGLPVEVLDEKGLNELIYSLISRDGYRFADELTASSAMSSFVDTEVSSFEKNLLKDETKLKLKSVLNQIDSNPEIFDSLEVKDVDTLRDFYDKYFMGREGA